MDGPTLSDRGFKHFDVIKGWRDNSTVRVFESSNAEEACLWLQVSCPEDLNKWEGPWNNTTAQLPLEQAELLRDQLTYLIEHHYQR